MFIAIDLDGTIAEYDSAHNWTVDAIGDPISGSLSFVELLHKLGHRLAIFSARAMHPRGIAVIEAWLEQHGFQPYIEFVTFEKRPEFEIIIDDRAIHCDKDYRSVMKEVLRRMARSGS